MTKIKSYKYGIIHAYAQCNGCDWDVAIKVYDKNRMQNLRNKIKSHINKTGHSVTLETGTSTIYTKE